jgi:hypothetical protein
LLYQAFQFRRRVFDFQVTVLAGSGFHCKQPASMSILKIAVRKFVSSLRMLREPLVDAQMPFGVRSESMKTNEFILFICRGAMLGPGAFVVRNNASLLDEVRGESQRIFV